MKQIAGRNGYPSVFSLTRDGDGLWLDGSWAGPAHEWDAGYMLMFRLRKFSSES
ncbi:MAG: hypothetical protein US31_C0002G0028 [Berkelbacteria bacterium GW2011_GWA1_36_9]|uniref:Uncharacterized protein n=1 Tax=Berkelbacteria bacterium GW2011_GWA1_36_9 TaxID=1618331 RepID=A0A0G0FI05_9BACT|nr:MAG: hypothetical protein US31_C0002G0028 [Berkelbacteria bacterium GW2011_GWA1_36_9]